MKLKLDIGQIEAYANARGAEDVFLHVWKQKHNRKDLEDCVERYMSTLMSYETRVPEEIRRRLHNFYSTKEIANSL